MKFLPQIKVYEVDYQFIIDNYTSPELWDKVWNLFVFKNYVYNLTLSSIDVKNHEIVLEIDLNSNLDFYNNRKSTYIRHNLKNSTINILKNQINNTMFYLAESLEDEVIERTEEYQEIENSEENEKQYLAELANAFLDENGVSNDDIREAYVNYYVDENDKTYYQLSDLKRKMKFNYLTDLFLILAECFNDSEKKKKVMNNQNNNEKISEILQEVKEYIQYVESEEWAEEMRDNLEAI